MLSFLDLDGITIHCIPKIFFFNHTHTYNKTKQAQDQAVDEKASPD